VTLLVYLQPKRGCFAQNRPKIKMLQITPPQSYTDVHEANGAVSCKPDPKRRENPLSLCLQCRFMPTRPPNARIIPLSTVLLLSRTKTGPLLAKLVPNGVHIPLHPLTASTRQAGPFRANQSLNSTNNSPLTVSPYLRPKRHRFAQTRPQMADRTHLDPRAASTTKTGPLRSNHTKNDTPQPSR